MIWKKWANWYKGAMIGLIVGFIVSIGITKDSGVWSSLSSPGLISCKILTQCPSCIGCKVIGLIFNLIYGFIIGALFGWLIDKTILGKSAEKEAREKSTKKKRR